MKKINKRLGKCYELSGRYIMDNEKAVLVHGKLVNPYGVGFKILDHAWIEEVEGEITLVKDLVMDKVWPAVYYYKKFKVKSPKKYKHRKAMDEMLRTGHFGSW